MAIKHLSIWLLLLLSGSSVFLSTGCECVESAYSFQTSALVSPGKEFLKVGDTLWVESSTSTTFRDANSGDDVDFSHSDNFGSGLIVTELIRNVDTAAGAIQHFDFIFEKGEPYPPNPISKNRSVYFKYEEGNGKYQFKVRMICRKPGIYAIFVADAVNVYRKVNGSCGRAGVGISISNTNKHLNYLQEIYYKGKPIAPLDQTNGYCFVVQ